MAEPDDFRADRSTSATLTLTLVSLAVLIVVSWVLRKRAAGRQPTMPAVTELAKVSAPPPDAGDPRIPQGEDRQPLSEYQILTPGSCHLMDDPGNGGDTFRAATAEGTHRFRLYWVRTAAVNGGDPVTAREITDHFALRDENHLQEVAKDAAKFSLGLLRARPFRMVTRWEKEPGDSAFLCYVYLDNGEGGWQDLAVWLVRSGLAMIAPTDRDPPEPHSSATAYHRQLKAEEEEARRNRTGAWAQ